jgi:mono/diheme cytochrome c family protein/glucose/arabinose dehydrogenase
VSRPRDFDSALAGALLIASLASPAFAQAGDRKGEEQPPLPPELALPAPPPLSPEDERSTFALESGLRIEIVAAEPLVHDPVQAVFDCDGALWVVEMGGYMPDVDGKGEREATGAIVVLRDTDGDGRMDVRAPFQDQLVLPRSVLPLGAGASDGALVIAPPELLLLRDTDGDGRADERTVVDRGLNGIESPEHAVNSLLFGLDNWIECANHPLRYRCVDDKWVRQPTASGGQWGLAKDDWGRLFFNNNTEPLRGHRYASHYAVRNPSLGVASGVNERCTDDFRVWPSHPTPGVNRGYQDGILKDGRLANFTAACSPLVYRGDALPALRGQAFVCEPAGNLLKRFALDESADGAVTARNLQDGREFLTSTDERFRPVNLAEGPDGALYVVDLYRGVIQHRLFVTTFLRRQIVARKLEQPLGRGRIWRIAAEGAVAAKTPARTALSAATPALVLAAMASPNGWTRDAAQRWLIAYVERTPELVARLKQMVLQSPSPQARIHALWCLEGIDGLDRAIAMQALGDRDAGVAIAALRTSERYLAGGDVPLIKKVVGLWGSADPRLRRQILLSAGEIPVKDRIGVLGYLMSQPEDCPDACSAVASGLRGCELEFLASSVAKTAWNEPNPRRREMIRLSTRCVLREGDSERMERIFALVLEAAEGQIWKAQPLLDGVLDARPTGPDGQPAPIRLQKKPKDFDAIDWLQHEELGERPHQVFLSVTWPGRTDLKTAVVRALDAQEQERFELGRKLYGTTCGLCHLPSGLGQADTAPPLRDSEWVLGPKERVARILLHGMQGPVRSGERDWNMEMPAFSGSDADIAAVLTYVRREWGHGAEPIAAPEVEAVRKAEADRKRAWTAEELRAIKN